MMLRDPEEAQDVAQEALVKLWQHRQGVDAEGARFWLTRVAHNLCIDRLRRRRREIGTDELESTQPDGTPGPLHLAQSVELGRLIQENLDKLSPEDRAVLLMREVQGLAYEEIAKAVDVPLGTLKARLHRARDRMRHRLTRAGVTP